MPGKRFLLPLACLAGIILGGAQQARARDQPFILGADISWIPEDEAAGAVYYDRGVPRDIFDILKQYNINYIRLRIFVNPAAAGGYNRQGFCDLEHTKAMAKRIQAAGMGFELDFHYSDTWASPEGQGKPAAWRNFTVEQLEKAVADHTREVLKALKDQGTPPEMVQIGNEVTHGMLWPEGRVWSQIPSGNAATDAKTAALGPGIGNYDNFARFLKAGIAAAREVDPKVKIILHNHLARHTPRMVEWMDELLKRDVKFDIIGMSAYSQGKEGDWKDTFAELAQRYPTHKQLVLEYSNRKRYLNDLIFNTPNDLGLGSFIWEPIHYREALFNKNGANAGGTQASDFVNDVGINQGAGGGPTTRTATLPPLVTPTAPAPATATASAPATATASAPATTPARGRGGRGNNSGRFDTNELLELYPKMYQDYGNDKFPPRAAAATPPK